MKKKVCFLSVFICLIVILSSCSIQKNANSSKIPSTFFVALAEKYNKNSYDYQFTEAEGISSDGAISFFIANQSIPEEPAASGKSRREYSFAQVNDYVQARFNYKGDYSNCFYYDLLRNCFYIPQVKTFSNKRIIIKNLTTVKTNVYSFSAEVSAPEHKTYGTYVLTLKQTITVETDGIYYKFLSVKKDWEKPGYYATAV